MLTHAVIVPVVHTRIVRLDQFGVTDTLPLQSSFPSSPTTRPDPVSEMPF